MSDNKIVVAIDGFSSCGKSTIAKRLAKDVGYIYVDTGAMYRAVGYFGIQNGIITENKIDEERLQREIGNLSIAFQNVGDEQHTFLNGIDVEHRIRTLEAGDAASRVSTIDFVRQEMVRRQQEMGAAKGIVMDGRDIGTVVFPDAELKIFVNADPEVRARQRTHGKGRESRLPLGTRQRHGTRLPRHTPQRESARTSQRRQATR